MAFKPAAIPFTSERSATRTGLVSSAPAGAFEVFLRRLTGDGAFNLFRAKSEVQAALREGAGTLADAPPLDDALPPESIPSVAAGWGHNRVLAEIDQDGFAFALDPMDEPFFNRRIHKTARQQNKLDIALLDGRICVRKRFRSYRLGARRWGNRPIPARDWVHRSVWVSLGFYMYSEAAALLRLRDVPFVPKLRKIDVAGRTLYIDYVPGESLRNQAARTGAAVHDADIHKNGDLRALSPQELERREVELLDRAGAGDFRREIAEMARQINARGVAPLDIKLGNFIRGARTGRLHWFDFEICRLGSQPRWETDLALQRDLLEQMFDLSARGHVVV
jgi:hypothetical protein